MGNGKTLQATWLGRYILDGHAIADEYRMTGSAGDLMVLGLDFRAYDALRRPWNMKSLNALSGTWMDLGSAELGGVRFDGKSIIVGLRVPVASYAHTRATDTHIAEKHFTRRGEKPGDEKTWTDFMLIECYRSKASPS